jgi:hypothetical protein
MYKNNIVKLGRIKIACHCAPMYEKLPCKIRKKKTNLLDMQAPHEPKQKSRR